MSQYCYITGLKTFPYEDGRSGGIFKYKIDIDGKEYRFVFSAYTNDWTTDESVLFDKGGTLEFYIIAKLRNIKNILTGLLLNDKWPKEHFIINMHTIDKIINEASYPKTYKEKLDNLFMTLFNMQSYDGDSINTEYLFESQNNFWKKLYFKDRGEGIFYLSTLIEQGYITGRKNDVSGSYQHIKFTYRGLEEAIKLTEEGQLSNNCFVAMSFDKEENSIFFDAIQPACKETRFEAKRVDYEQYESEKTINDAIIALLKQCKFCIADFTKQKDGVYFEAGYALGRNMKVIYTCREDYFKQCHFDTSHFPHIVYKTTEELKKKLIDKIEAYIKD
jgi:nucleoside 2-deoxyribosyltransferase